MREANTLVDVSSFLVQIFSGTNFPVNALPYLLLPIALALPYLWLGRRPRHLMAQTPSCHCNGKSFC